MSRHDTCPCLRSRIPRIETRRRIRGFVLGLVADLPRKNCWSIAEHAGDRDPHGMQYLLARASVLRRKFKR